MDVNNTPYFLLRGPEDFRQGSSHLNWHPDLKALTLAQNQSLRLPVIDTAAALAAWESSTPLALDSFNQVARLSADGLRIEVFSGRYDPNTKAPLYLPLQDSELNDVVAPAGRFTDMAFAAVPVVADTGFGQPAGDGRLALPYSDDNDQHGLLLFHLSRRWQTVCSWDNDGEAGASGHKPLRASVDAENRVWMIADNALILCTGEPLPLPYTQQATRFEPLQSNPHPLRREWRQVLPSPWRALALCCDLQWLYLLCHDGGGKQAILARPLSVQANAPFDIYACPATLPFVVDLAVVGASALPEGSRLAALAPREPGDDNFTQRDCSVLGLRWDDETDRGAARVVLERYPMLSLLQPRFVSSADGQLRYQGEADSAFPDITPRPRELHALRRPQYFKEGKALLQTILDSGQPDTHWHRIYLDACIPAGCEILIGVRVFASKEPGEPRPEPVIQPEPLWNPLPSEIAFGESLAGQKAGSSGLFEILLQHADGPVRQMRGRYMQIKVILRGDGRQSPTLHAIRVYYPRFSYQEAYLPEFFRQEMAYDENQAFGSANAADVRERLLAAFEGVLTPIEGLIAASERLAHPGATPVANLPWLAEALGESLPLHWPQARQRRWLNDVTLIQQFKGTLGGIRLALDILSDGGIGRGEIAVLENFCLRRTMATILGINMDDADHPLTLGTGMSGNSIIGDSLILSESDARVFLALFAPELANKDEKAQVEAFFAEYAHQVSILLHGPAVGLRHAVEDVLKEQLPAHLQYRIIETEHPFILGIAPLLGLDTFIETTPAPRRVKLNDTYLGREGILKNPAAFSPEDINASA